MPYINKKRHARSKNSYRRAKAYRNALAKESFLSKQRLLEEEEIKQQNKQSKKSVIEILREKELMEQEAKTSTRGESNAKNYSSDDDLEEEKNNIQNSISKKLRKINLTFHYF